MSDSDIVKLVLSFLTGGSLVAAFNFVKWYLEFNQQKRNNRIPDVLHRVVNLYRELNIIVQELGAVRACVLRAENGGEIPTVGKDLFSSIVYEVFDNNLHSVKDDWQKQRLDESYISMLLLIARDQNIVVNTPSLPDGILKDFHTATNVNTSYFVKLHVREGAFFYLSISFEKEAVLSPTQRNILRAVSQRITTLLSFDDT